MAVTPPTIVGPVSIGASVSGLPGNVLTLPHTVPAGAQALYFYLSWDTFFAVIPDVTWMGTPLVLLHMPPTATLRGCLYQLLNPTPGSGDIVSTASVVHGTSQAGCAFNLTDLGGVRFAEFEYRFWFDPDFDDLDVGIYSDPTDLVLTFPGYYGSAATVTPDPGITVLAAQGGGMALACGQVTAPVAVGVPAVQANSTRADWTISSIPFNAGATNYTIAFKGLDDAAPAGAPATIGRVTDSMTVEQQPQTGVALADNPWTWRHEVPSTHRTLVVLATWFDTGVSAVTFQLDGGLALPLTELVQANSAGCWILEDAPVGVGYIRVILSVPRWCGAAAYSISGTDVTADVFRGGIDPNYMRIDTTPGNLVVDRIGQQTNEFLSWTPDSGLVFFNEPIYGRLNERTNTTGSNSGGSSCRTAIGNSTDMPWTPNPGAATFSQAGFTFLGVEPPPPERPGCPDSLAVLPADGQGCDTQVAPQAV